MLRSHCAECLSTGSPVIGVFQTLSAGNAGQWVRGISWPAAAPPPAASAATPPAPNDATSTAASTAETPRALAGTRRV